MGLIIIPLLLAGLSLVACGADADPFSGQYWEPASGRRIEIRRDDGAYALYYGRERHSYPARLDGDRLVISDPMGGQTVVRPGRDEGTLELVSGGETTVLKPLPQHQ